MEKWSKALVTDALMPSAKGAWHRHPFQARHCPDCGHGGVNAPRPVSAFGERHSEWVIIRSGEQAVANLADSE